MIAYASFEWLKLRKRWMPRVIVALALGLIILAFWGQSTHDRGGDLPNLLLPRGWLAALIFCSFFAPFFWPVLGGSWAGNEYGWGTIRMILTRRPHRIQYALTSLAVLVAGLALAILVVLAVATIASFVVSLATGNSTFTTGIFDGTFLATLIKSFLSAWYVATFYLVLSYAAATVFRSAAVGIGIGIGSTLAEFIVRGIFASLGGTWDDIAQHFPVIYTNELVTRVASSAFIPGSNMASVDSRVPDAAHSVVAIAVYMGICLIATAATIRLRDVTS